MLEVFACTAYSHDVNRTHTLKLMEMRLVEHTDISICVYNTNKDSLLLLQ